MSKNEKISDTQRKLTELVNQGFKYIVSNESGDEWVGSNEQGLLIEKVLRTHFQGEIKCDPRNNEETKKSV